jgi:hypothetical protein
MSAADSDVRAFSNESDHKIESPVIVSASTVCSQCVPEFESFKTKMEGELKVLRAEFEITRKSLDIYENKSRADITQLKEDNGLLNKDMKETTDDICELQQMQREAAENNSFLASVIFGTMTFVFGFFMYYVRKSF